MKTKFIVILLAVFLVICTVGCKSTPKFSDVTGKEWKLIDVRINNKSISFDRDVLIEEGFGEIFTLNFDIERLSGTGAPNRYVAPYTLGKNLEISVKPIAGTLMAPVRQPEKLKEHDFFTYIQNTYKWNLVNANLELSTKGEDGGEATMVFKL